MRRSLLYDGCADGERARCAKQLAFHSGQGAASGDECPRLPVTPFRSKLLPD